MATPDGTEYDLRDEPSRGHPKTEPVESRNRGSVFVSVDGGGATFISHLHDASQTRVDIYDRNSPSGAYPVTGTLFLRDGTRYRIEDGKITRITDRNGNYFEIAYDEVDRVSTITDSIGRTVHIAYADPASAGECSDPDCTADRITYKGSDGTDRTISVYRTSLGSRLRDGFQISNRTDMFYQSPPPARRVPFL